MAANTNGLSRDLIIHPGETLKEILEDREMSQRELALRADVTEKHISNVVNCLKPISVNFAKKLEYALGIDASFWINLQANYDKELADFEEVNKISSEELAISKRLIKVVEHLQQMGILAVETNASAQVIKLRKVLNISSLLRIPEVSLVGAYRVSAATNADPYIMFAWLRMCDLIDSYDTVETELNINELKRKLPLIKELMFDDAANIQPNLKAYFAECGIKFSIVKYFTGAPVQGVIKRNDDGTVSLIMTVRQKFADIFWFTLFHEIGHIINGDLKTNLIDYSDTKNELEEKADEFAKKNLIDTKKYTRFVNSEDYSLSNINQFSAKNKIPNYILIGRLQRDGYLKYNRYTQEKVRYKLKEA